MNKQLNRKKTQPFYRIDLTQNQSSKNTSKSPTSAFKLDFTNVKNHPVQSQRRPLGQIQQQIYNRFKDSLLQEKLKDNKSVHLKIKQQNQMIQNIKNQILDNKLTQTSSFMSQSLQQGCVSNISKKLGVLQKSYLQKTKLHKVSSRARIIRNIKKQDQIQLTDQQLKQINRLPVQCINKIINIYRTYKKYVQKSENVQKMHNELLTREKCYQDKIEQLKIQLNIIENQRQTAVKQKSIKQSEYEQLQSRIQQMLQQQRIKCLFEFREGQKFQERDLEKLNS